MRVTWAKKHHGSSIKETHQETQHLRAWGPPPVPRRDTQREPCPFTAEERAKPGWRQVTMHSYS